MIKLKKSQAAVDYMWISGFLLIGVLFIFYYTSGETLIRARLDSASDAVNAIATTSDVIGAMEDGSQAQIWVKIPRGVVSTSVANKQAQIELRSFKGAVTDIFAITEFDLQGEIPSQVGVHRLNIQKNGTAVLITK